MTGKGTGLSFPGEVPIWMHLFSFNSLAEITDVQLARHAAVPDWPVATRCKVEKIDRADWFCTPFTY